MEERRVTKIAPQDTKKGSEMLYKVTTGPETLELIIKLQVNP